MSELEHQVVAHDYKLVIYCTHYFLCALAWQGAAQIQIIQEIFVLAQTDLRRELVSQQLNTMTWICLIGHIKEETSLYGGILFGRNALNCDAIKISSHL